MAASPSGWALRKNGTCEIQEVDCGQTVAPYRVCCPHASSCPPQYNSGCCPTSANCTLSLIPNPKCANETWDLYDNDGYFCCLPGLLGYAAKSTNSNGCASPGYQLQPGEVLLRLLKAGTSSGPGDGTPTSSGPGDGTPATISPSSAPTTTSLQLNGGGLSTSAKAGIGVGAGVGGMILLAVAAFFLWRRRRNKQQQVNHERKPGAADEILVIGGSQELPGEEAPPAKEMDGPSRYLPELGDGHHHELEGDSSHRAEVPG